MVNPKICGGMEVEFLVAKAHHGKFCACEVTLPGGTPIGDLPEREPREAPRGLQRAREPPQRRVGGHCGEGQPSPGKRFHPPPLGARGDSSVNCVQEVRTYMFGEERVRFLGESERRGKDLFFWTVNVNA